MKIAYNMSLIHIIPTEDLEKHEESIKCKCGPKIEVVKGNTVVTHYRFDGLEEIGEDTKIKSN